MHGRKQMKSQIIVNKNSLKINEKNKFKNI